MLMETLGNELSNGANVNTVCVAYSMPQSLLYIIGFFCIVSRFLTFGKLYFLVESVSRFRLTVAGESVLHLADSPNLLRQT